MIHVGLILNGPEQPGAVARELVEELRRRLASVDTGDSSLDLVFVVGGLFGDPPFKGVRRGRLSKQGRIVQIQVAIPAGALTDRPGLVWDLARAAITRTPEILRTAGLDFRAAAALECLPRRTHPADWSAPVEHEARLELWLPDHESDGIADAIEDSLERAFSIDREGRVDGHESDANGRTIYIVGRDLITIRDRVLQALARHRLPRGAKLLERDPASDRDHLVEIPPA